MKTKVEETKADGIKLDRVDEIKADGIKVDRVEEIRADEIQILNNHDVSPIADSRMNLKVVPDRDNAHPKGRFKFNFDQSETVLRKRSSHDRF